MYNDLNPIVAKYQEFLNQCLACENISQYSDLVERWDQEHPGMMHKLNLRTAHGSSEGVWALCLTKEDKKLVENDSAKGDKYVAIICNMPIMVDLCWGAFVVATTNGVDRPSASIEDQTVLNDVTNHIKSIIEQDTSI